MQSSSRSHSRPTFNIYDPTNARGSSYWQFDAPASWDAIAALINQGIPRRCADALRLPLPSGDGNADCVEYFGALRRGDELWFYRIDPTGRDSYGRLGGYRVAVFDLPSSDAIHSLWIDRVGQLSVRGRTTPLDVSALEQLRLGGASSSEFATKPPSALMQEIRARIDALRGETHQGWIVRNGQIEETLVGLPIPAAVVPQRVASTDAPMESERNPSSQAQAALPRRVGASQVVHKRFDPNQMIFGAALTLVLMLAFLIVFFEPQQFYDGSILLLHRNSKIEAEEVQKLFNAKKNKAGDANRKNLEDKKIVPNEGGSKSN